MVCAALRKERAATMIEATRVIAPATIQGTVDSIDAVSFPRLTTQAEARPATRAVKVETSELAESILLKLFVVMMVRSGDHPVSLPQFE